MNDKKCKALWFWAVGIISAAAYMLWYTFKNNILTLTGVLFGIICKIKKRESDNVDKDIWNYDLLHSSSCNDETICSH